MKTKLSRVLIAVISVVMMLTAVPAVDYYVSTPTAVTASAASKKTALNKSKVTVTTGDSYILKLLSSKKKAITKNVKWSTSNKKIATVSSKGVVKAVKKGTATITAKYKGKKYTCKVTVKNPSLSATKKTLNVGKSFTLSLKNASGKKISTKNISFKSSKTSVATVSSKGVVKAKKKGSATITATYKGKKYTCKVTVSSFGVAESNVVLYEGETFVQKFYDKNGNKVTDDLYLHWDTENWGIADIGSRDGLIEANEPGKVRMYANYHNEIYYFNVTVKEHKVTVSKNSATLKPGETLKLTAKTSPEGKTVKWVSDNEKVAVVSGKGVVTPVGGGTCNITAIYQYGDTYDTAEDSCSVTCVYDGSYSFETEHVTTYLGARVNQRFYGGDGSDVTEDVDYWSSENSYIAYMNDDTATIVPVRVGTVKICAHYEGEKYYFTVTIKEPYISLNKTSVTLKEGESVKLIADMGPKDAKIEWKSSDDSVATVTKDGTVTAEQTGKCEITATFEVDYDEYEAQCTVICGNDGEMDVTPGSTFTNPLPGINDRTITVQTYSHQPKYKIKMDIYKVQRGEEANRIAKHENRYNKTEAGCEWCLIYADIEHISNSEGNSTPLSITDVLYYDYIFTTSGAKVQDRYHAAFGYELASMRVLDAELYPGASGKYVIGMLIPESTGDLLLKVRNLERATWIEVKEGSTTVDTPEDDFEDDDIYDVFEDNFDAGFEDDFEDTSSSESDSTAEKNFTMLKNYISSNGKADANGKTKSLMKSFDADGGIFSAKITYNNSADEMIFWFCTEPDYGSPTTVSFTMKDTTSPFVVTANLNVSDESMLATGSSTGKVTITPSQYNPQNTESFVWSDVYVASLYGDDGIREAITGTGGNATASGWLDAGNIFWNTIIRDAIGLTMKDIGFDNAAVETLEDIDIA